MLFFRQLECLKKSSFILRLRCVIALSTKTGLTLQWGWANKQSVMCGIEFPVSSPRDFDLAVELAFVISSFVWYFMMFWGS